MQHNSKAPQTTAPQIIIQLDQYLSETVSTESWHQNRREGSIYWSPAEVRLYKIV